MISNSELKTMTHKELYDRAERLLEDAYLLLRTARYRHEAYMNRGVGPTPTDHVDEYAGLSLIDSPVTPYYPTDDGE